ncbi:MAG TPA: hypothetical protein VN456_10315 [Desulfosporosinus sp.]|nr:hypothetical protein [Desulfosporosinus sp.]
MCLQSNTFSYGKGEEREATEDELKIRLSCFDYLKGKDLLKAEAVSEYGSKGYSRFYEDDPELSEDNIREPVTSTDEISYHIFHKGIFGMTPEDKRLLEYLLALPENRAELFNWTELNQIYTLAIAAGQSGDLDKTALKTLEAIVYKLDRVFPAPLETAENVREEMKNRRCDAAYGTNSNETSSLYRGTDRTGQPGQPSGACPAVRLQAGKGRAQSLPCPKFRRSLHLQGQQPLLPLDL